MPDEMAPNSGDLGNNAGPKEGSFTPAAAGSLLGGAILQTAIEGNTRAMNDLATQIKDMGGSSSFAKVGPNQFTTQAKQTMGQSINNMMGGQNGGQSMPAPMLGQMGQNSPGGGGFAGQSPSMGPAGSYGQGGTYGAQASPPQAMAGGAGGGMGGGGRSPFASAPGFSNNGSSNMLGAAVGGGGIGGVLGAFSNMANKQLPQQVALNTYQQQMSYMGGRPQGVASSLLGSGGGGYNYMAQSMPDALAMGSTIAQASGSPYAGMGGFGTNPLSRAMYGGAAGYQLGSPGMSGAAAANASAALFSPQTSWNMRLLGMRTPLGPGGQTAMSQAQVFNSFNQRFVKPGTSQKDYANYFRQGGVGWMNVMSTLANNNPQFAQADIQAMEMQHSLSLKGWAPGKIQNTIDAFSKGSPDARSRAQKELQSAGIKTPDVSKIQSALAPNLARTADQSQGFTTGLSAATTTVQKFNTALAHMMKSSGLDKYVGIGAGAAAGTKALEPGFFKTASSVASHVPFIGSFLGGAINAIGGGAAPVTTGGAIVPTPKQAPKGAKMTNPSGQSIKAIHAAETQIGVPYVWGAESPGKGFDCSALMQWSYQQAGVKIPRTSGQQWNALKDRQVPLNQVQAGDLVFAAGSDGTKTNPGHVAMMISNNQLIQAAHTGTHIAISSFHAGAWQHAARPTGSRNTKATAKPVSGQGSTGTSGGVMANSGADISGGGMGSEGAKGLGDILTGGSKQEIASFMGAITGGAHGGSGFYGNTKSLTEIPGVSSGGSTPATGGFTGTGGKAVYTFLLNNVFHGNKIAAAGATASIWGESQWNPEAQGTGGRGLIGWTPPSTLPNSAFTGNASKDMAAQLAQIPIFIAKSGDQGVIQQMMHASSVEAAANMWMRGVERAGISDVHSAGLAQAKAIAGLAVGGAGRPGQFAWVGERGPELVRFGRDAHVMNADQTAKIAKSSMAQSPQAPHVAGITSGIQPSPLHPIYSGGKGSTGGFGNQIVLHFDENSIAIKMPTSTTDTGQSGRAMAEAFVNHVSTTKLYKGIAQGKK